jgi:hypothetical protein
VKRPALTSARIGLLLPLALLAACGAGGEAFTRSGHDHPEPVINRPTADGEAARDYLSSLQALLAATPAGQAEIFQNARLASENAPTTVSRLRFALMLAMPGHPASDPVAARRQLSDLLARPELLLPAERSLAAVLLASVDERLVLVAETHRLEQDASARDHDRAAQGQKRLQAEVDENARLKRALEDAQKKLDAVTQVERSITGRASPPKT